MDWKNARRISAWNSTRLVQCLDFCYSELFYLRCISKYNAQGTKKKKKRFDMCFRRCLFLHNEVFPSRGTGVISQQLRFLPTCGLTQ